MKKIFFSLLMAALCLPLFAEQERMTFVISGPESRYNQIRLVNETSQRDFPCRVYLLYDDNSVAQLYGEYRLQGRGDVDTNSAMVDRGVHIGIQMPKDFPVEVTFDVEYRDYPFYDAVIIHLRDKGPSAEFDEF